MNEERETRIGSVTHFQTQVCWQPRGKQIWRDVLTKKIKESGIDIRGFGNAHFSNCN